MLSQAGIAPPQLDEFFLPLRADELRALGSRLTRREMPPAGRLGWGATPRALDTHHAPSLTRFGTPAPPAAGGVLAQWAWHAAW